MSEVIQTNDEPPSWRASMKIETLPEQVQKPFERFLDIRAANRAAYLVLLEEQFEQQINDIVTSPRELLIHQILHTEARINSFNGTSQKEDMPTICEALLSRLDRVTQELYVIYQNPENITRQIQLPWTQGTVDGQEVLARIREHEAEHEGAMRVYITSLGYSLPLEMLKAFGS